MSVQSAGHTCRANGLPSSAQLFTLKSELALCLLLLLIHIQREIGKREVLLELTLVPHTWLSACPFSWLQALAFAIIVTTCSHCLSGSFPPHTEFAHEGNLLPSQEIIILIKTFCRVPGPLGIEPHFVHIKPSIITTIVVIIIIWD